VNCAGHPDVNARELRPTEVARAPEGPGIGNDPERPEAIGRQKMPLDDGVGRRQRRSSGQADGREPFDMARADDDVATPAALEAEVGTLGGKDVADLGVQRLFAPPLDPNIVEIQAPGLKSVTIKDGGPDARGTLRPAAGVHRWARKSPIGGVGRRHRCGGGERGRPCVPAHPESGQRLAALRPRVDGGAP
jgi:peptide chain release factor 2